MTTVVPICQEIAYSFRKGIDFSYKNGMFKWQLNQDRLGLRFLPNICHLPDPLFTARYKPLLTFKYLNYFQIPVPRTSKDLHQDYFLMQQGTCNIY
jgi:hypothetical protein